MTRIEASAQPRIWLITGAAGALGSELVCQLMRRGDDCIALDRNQRGLNALHHRCEDLGLPRPALMPLDLIGASSDDYAQLAETIAEQFGRLDVLVHNAAQMPALRPLAHQDATEWLHGLQWGLTGPVWLTRALLPLMSATRGSSARAQIIWVGDQAVIDQPANWGVYGLVQAGRQWLAQALSAELGPRAPWVRVLDPGPFFSPLRTAAWPAQRPDEVPSAHQAALDLLARIETADDGGEYG
jgi:NAD(P)-dependent dehydrogenase (short-subunit alcohol dehydrogenase family)